MHSSWQCLLDFHSRDGGCYFYMIVMEKVLIKRLISEQVLVGVAMKSTPRSMKYPILA